MGNIIMCCIRFQIKAYGLGNHLDLETQYYLVQCSSCQKRHLRVPSGEEEEERCDACGGTCVLLGSSQSSRRERNGLGDVEVQSGRIARNTASASASARTGNTARAAPSTTAKLPKVPDSQSLDLQTATTAIHQLHQLLHHTDTTPLLLHCHSDSDSHPALTTALDAISCPVCLEPYTDPTTLSCGHSLCARHVGELQTWACPVCRAPFLDGEDTTRRREGYRVAMVSKNTRLVECVQEVLRLKDMIQQEQHQEDDEEVTGDFVPQEDDNGSSRMGIRIRGPRQDAHEAYCA